MDDLYHPRLSPTEIRLFQLIPSPSDTVTLRLERFTLDSSPAFQATSYVWGDPSPPNPPTVLVNNTHSHTILPNALAFFRAMLTPESRETFPPDTTWWWMDCVCINQTDPAERGEQVRLMGAIYKRALATVIWLGEASEDSDAAMAFLRLLAAQEKPVPQDDVEILKATEEWRAVGRLLARGWWERGWTLQEFLIGGEAVMYCGGSWIGAKGMFRGVKRVRDWSQVRGMEALIPRTMYEKAWNRFRLLEWWVDRGEMPLVGMMAFTATSRVTDPSDRIYSVLGLASERDRMVVGTPDYFCHPAVVFSGFVKAFVETHQSLDIVCVARALDDDLVVGDGESPGVCRGLASWVPDWSLRCKISPPLLCLASQSASTHIGNFRPLRSWEYSCRYEASGKIAPRVLFSEDLREATCAGIFVDVVDGLGGVKPARHPLIEMVPSTSTVNLLTASTAVERTTPALEMEAKGFLLFDRLSRCLSVDRLDRYLRYPAPRAQFSREFEILCRVASDNPEGVLPAFSQWLQCNKNLEIGGLTLAAAIDHTASAETAALPSAAGQRGRTLPPGIRPQDIVSITDWQGFLARSHTTVSRMGRRLMVTDTGLVGMAPKKARKGDVVCVLFGCSLPLVLRPNPDHDAFTLVGECYLDGYMNGEILEEVRAQRRETREFRIL